jgi:hypothetical protein
VLLHGERLEVIKGVKNGVSPRNLFPELKILTVTLLCIFEILCFIIKIRFILPSILMFVIIILFTNTICVYNSEIPSIEKEGFIHYIHTYIKYIPWIRS